MATKTQTQSKRGPGRPASFPGVKTKAFLATIPETTRNLIRQFAEKRDLNVNQAVDVLIQRGYKVVAPRS